MSEQGMCKLCGLPIDLVGRVGWYRAKDGYCGSCMARTGVENRPLIDALAARLAEAERDRREALDLLYAVACSGDVTRPDIQQWLVSNTTYAAECAASEERAKAAELERDDWKATVEALENAGLMSHWRERAASAEAERDEYRQAARAEANLGDEQREQIGNLIRSRQAVEARLAEVVARADAAEATWRRVEGEWYAALERAASAEKRAESAERALAALREWLDRPDVMADIVMPHCAGVPVNADIEATVERSVQAAAIKDAEQRVIAAATAVWTSAIADQECACCLTVYREAVNALGTALAAARGTGDGGEGDGSEGGTGGTHR